MSLPKDFTTARPRAYSRMAPVISRLACASTGAFCALYREMSSRKPSDTAAASKAMSAVRGLNTNRLRNTPPLLSRENRLAHGPRCVPAPTKSSIPSFPCAITLTPGPKSIPSVQTRSQRFGHTHGGDAFLTANYCCSTLFFSSFRAAHKL